INYFKIKSFCSIRQSLPLDHGILFTGIKEEAKTLKLDDFHNRFNLGGNRYGIVRSTDITSWCFQTLHDLRFYRASHTTEKLWHSIVHDSFRSLGDRRSKRIDVIKIVHFGL